MAFQPDWPTDARPLFEPAIVDARGVYIIGCAAAVAVFQVFSRSRAWFTIKAQVKITGYAVSSTSLYVQDGPVISGWDLTYGGCFRGYNIATKKEWKPPVSENPFAIATPPASLYDMSGAASNDAVEFSAPVVRESQLQGEAQGQVFVLGSDGSIYSFDDGLVPPEAGPTPVRLRAPLRLELVMGELPQPSGDVLCRLYYIDKAGAIVAVNASLTPLRELTGWAAKGTLDPAKVLPLRFIDGLLWGGGILGADFFALTPDPTQPPRLTVPAKGVWRDYDVEPEERLAVVTDGKVSRLVAYGDGVKLRDRWGERTTATAGQSRVWPGVGTGAPRGPALVLEVDDGVSASGAAFRVVLANTVDADEPARVPNYPPPATQIDAAIMAPGSFKTATLGAIAWFRSKAIVARHTLYGVVRGSAANPDMLVVFLLASERASLVDRANAALADLRMRARPIRVQIIKVVVYHVRDDGRIQRGDPAAAGNVSCQLAIQGFPDCAVRTDGQGFIYLDPKYNGAPASLTKDLAPWSSAGPSWVEPASLTLDWTKNDGQLWIELHVWTGWGQEAPTDAPGGGAA